jgi:putative CocE/NonD family hydrolase
MLVFDQARRDGDVDRMADLSRLLGEREVPLRAVDHELYRDARQSFFRDWVDHPLRDEYWEPWAMTGCYREIDVPALHVGGWYDIFLTGTVANFQGLRRAGAAPQRLVIGPHAHTSWAPVGPDATSGPNELDDLHVSWLRQVLGAATVADGAPVRVHLPGEGWIDLPDWPPAATTRVLYLRSGGRANSRFGDGRLEPEPPGDEPPDVYVYDPYAPAPSAGGHSCCQPLVTGPADQAARESGKTVLVYTSAPFDESVTLLGEPVVTLYAATSALDTDFTARLCAVDERGRSLNLQEAIVRSSLRNSRSHAQELEPNAVQRYQLELGPVVAELPRGSRLRLQVASADFPMWEPNLNRGPRSNPGEPGEIATQLVFHDAARPSCIALPFLDR